MNLAGKKSNLIHTASLNVGSIVHMCLLLSLDKLYFSNLSNFTSETLSKTDTGIPQLTCFFMAAKKLC